MALNGSRSVLNPDQLTWVGLASPKDSDPRWRTASGPRLAWLEPRPDEEYDLIVAEWLMAEGEDP